MKLLRVPVGVLRAPCYMGSAIKTALCIGLVIGAALASAAFGAAPGAAPIEPLDQRVDASVERGLGFLAAGQLSDGSFNSRPGREFPAIAGLCGMAFLAKGYVPGAAGRYSGNIERAADFILSRAASDGYLGGDKGRMYSHCISTLFLSEISGMVDSNLQAKIDAVLPKAVQVILSAQRVPKNFMNTGGWRYGPGSRDSDMSCSGWALMALRSARLNGAPVPAQAIKDAVQFVLRHQDANLGCFGYENTTTHAVTLSGAGLLCLELCGQHGSPATRRAGKYLMDVYETLPKRPRCFYGLYYTAQGLFQIGGEEWRRFSTWMYDFWIPRQNVDGSWDRGEIQCPYYQTSLVILAFTVPYRQLPIYQRDETVDAE